MKIRLRIALGAVAIGAVVGAATLAGAARHEAAAKRVLAADAPAGAGASRPSGQRAAFRTTGPIVTTATPVSTPGLLELAALAPVVAGAREVEIENRDPVASPGPSALDPVAQTTLGPRVMPAPLASFEGLNNDDNPGNSLVIPPDTEGDVGPNHYFEWINISLAIYNKAGAKLFGPVAGNTLFATLPAGDKCRTTNSGDPLVQYDQLADRWVVTQFTGSTAPYFQCIAVSKTPDPLSPAGYCVYSFQVSTTVFNDYPKLGIWPDAYYFSGAGFPASGFTPQAYAVDRAKMLACQPATLVYFDAFNNTALSQSAQNRMLPSDLDGATLPPAGEPNPYVMHDDVNDRLQLFEFHVDWTTPASSTFTKIADLPVAPFDTAFACNTGANNRQCVPQPLIPNRIDNLATRLMYELNYRNYGSHQALVVNQTVDVNDTPDHSGVRWYELRDPHGTPTVFQQGTYAPDADHRFMGSAAMDKSGNLAVAYSVSGLQTFPSLRYAGRVPSDPLGQLGQGEATLFAGAGSQIAGGFVGVGATSRWGDYSHLTLDPVDDCTFWYINEYYTADQLEWVDGIWHTRIGSFKFPQCGVTTAARVTAFAARWRGQAIRVGWRTASELDAVGFNVYRSVGTGPFRKLNRTLLVARRAGGARGAAYSLVDRAVARGKTYTYRLQLVSKSGKRTWYGVGSAAS